MKLNDFLVNSKNSYSQFLSSNETLKLIIKATDICEKALKSSQKLILCGNGGSAADSQHIAAELVSRFAFDRDPLPAIALTTDTSILTSIANDYTFDNVFSRQIEALGKKGDVLIAYSTSGKSQNIINAAIQAKKQKLKTIVITGQDLTELHDYADLSICSNSKFTPIIQQSHLFIGHAICLELENRIFG